MKIHNFSAGPSVLAESVIKEASKAVIELNDIGLSLLEISHRSKHFTEIIEETKELTKELLNISNDYEVLFLQGGASLQFYMSALNFSNNHGKSGYIDTGTWSSKAIAESKKLGGKTMIIGSSKDKNYNYIPKEIIEKQKLDYVHFTSNNTIYGTQYHSFKNILNHYPDTALICDMSSDIFSREINVNNFALIYAGAQKNLGPAGTTLVIVKKSIFNPEKTHFTKNHLEHINNLPSYLKYTTHIEKSSMFNTPPVFSIYTCMLTLRWLKNIGGIAAINQKNQKKSNLIYREIDRNSLFEGYTQQEDRSIMNATFILKNPDLKDKFQKLCTERGISGINGHRSVGGYRASMYNALDIESINALTETMQQLEKIG